MDTRDTLSPLTRRLHWIVAAVMIVMIGTGMVMDDLDVPIVFDTHTTLGWLALAVVVPRAILRLREGWPAPVGHYSQLEHLAGKLVHWALLLSTLLMPLTGILLAVANGHGLAFYSVALIPENPDPANPEEVIPLSPGLGELGDSIHGFVGELLPFLIALHVIGALKHHLVDRDDTLRRMLG